MDTSKFIFPLVSNEVLTIKDVSFDTVLVEAGSSIMVSASVIGGNLTIKVFTHELGKCVND